MCSSLGLCIISMLYRHNTSIYNYHLFKTTLLSYCKFHTIPMIYNHTTMICPQNTMILTVTWQLWSSSTESRVVYHIYFNSIFSNKLSLHYINEGQPYYINRHLLTIWDQHYSKTIYDPQSCSADYLKNQYNFERKIKIYVCSINTT